MELVLIYNRILWQHGNYTWNSTDPDSVHKEQVMRSCDDLFVVALTHWGRDKMAANFLTTFSNAFSCMKMYKFRSIFPWTLFPRIQLTMLKHLFRKWLGTDQATSHYLNQWLFNYWHTYVSLVNYVLRKEWSCWWIDRPQRSFDVNIMRHLVAKRKHKQLVKLQMYYEIICLTTHLVLLQQECVFIQDEITQPWSINYLQNRNLTRQLFNWTHNSCGLWF